MSRAHTLRVAPIFGPRHVVKLVRSAAVLWGDGDPTPDQACAWLLAIFRKLTATWHAWVFQQLQTNSQSGVSCAGKPKCGAECAQKLARFGLSGQTIIRSLIEILFEASNRRTLPRTSCMPSSVASNCQMVPTLLAIIEEIALSSASLNISQALCDSRRDFCCSGDKRAIKRLYILFISASHISRAWFSAARIPTVDGSFDIFCSSHTSIRCFDVLSSLKQKVGKTVINISKT